MKYLVCITWLIQMFDNNVTFPFGSIAVASRIQLSITHDRYLNNSVFDKMDTRLADIILISKLRWEMYMQKANTETK
jgi:hypothetical protein